MQTRQKGHAYTALSFLKFISIVLNANVSECSLDKARWTKNEYELCQKKFPGNATWKDHKSVNANVISISLLLPKIIDDKVKADTQDA